MGFKPQEHVDFKIQNMVGTADVGYPIRLEGLVYAHSSFASYEPELFPGLIYRLASPRVVFLIFVSGKLVITGAKTEREMTDAFTKLYPVLIEFRKAAVAPIPGNVQNMTNNMLPPLSKATTSLSANIGVASNDQQRLDQR